MATTLSPMSTLRRPLVWLLVLATLVYGPSSVLVGMLGTRHVHQTTQADPWAAVHEAFAAVRAWRAALHDQLLPHGHAQGHGHDHAHDTWQRHHHDAHDGSVIALDGAAGHDAANPAAGGSAALPLAPAPTPGVLPAPRATVQPWRRAQDPRWSDAPLALDVPPPRA